MIESFADSENSLIARRAPLDLISAQIDAGKPSAARASVI
jgi:hypothetical protein